MVKKDRLEIPELTLISSEDSTVHHQDNLIEISRRTLEEGRTDLPVIFEDSQDAHFIVNINNDPELSGLRANILTNIIGHQFNGEFFNLITRSPSIHQFILEISRNPISSDSYSNLLNILSLGSSDISTINEVITTLLTYIPLDPSTSSNPISIIDSNTESASRELEESRAAADSNVDQSDESTRRAIDRATAFNFRRALRWGVGLVFTGIGSYYLGPQVTPIIAESLRRFQQLQSTSIDVSGLHSANDRNSDTTVIRDVAHTLYCWFRDLARDIRDGRP